MTNVSFLCRYDRRKRHGDKDWRIVHEGYIRQWEERTRHEVDEGDEHVQYVFDEYLWWLHRSARTHIKAPYTNVPISDDEEEDVIEDVYDAEIRDDIMVERAPMQRYVVS